MDREPSSNINETDKWGYNFPKIENDVSNCCVILGQFWKMYPFSEGWSFRK